MNIFRYHSKRGIYDLMINKLFLILLIIFSTNLLSAQIQTDQEIALVFSGGGGRGAYEIGVWKALSDLGFKIGGVYGASVGSINGPGIIMNDYKKVRDLWFEISYFTVMDISTAAENFLRGDFDKLSFENYIDIMKEFRSNKGIDVSPLRQLLTNIISEEEVRSSEIDYGLVIFSVSKMEPIMLYIDQIPEGELIDYILASANFPLFKRAEIRGETLIDGGVYSNVPVEMAVNRGFKDIVVVDLAFQTPIDIANSVKQNFYNSYNLTIIKPREHYGSFLTFEKDISEKYLIEGYLDTMKKYNYLYGEEYYIYGYENIIEKMFNNLNIEKQKEALRLLGIGKNKRVKTNKYFTDLVIPVFKSALLSKFDNKTENISLDLMEKLAGITYIEPLTVYTQKEMLHQIIIGIEKIRLNSPIFEFIINLRYQKIIKFLKYLNKNSIDNISIPKGYYDFMLRYNTLLEK